MALRRFYISPETASQRFAEITGSDAVHIARVLRLNTGDRIELFDGSETVHRARIIATTPRNVKVEIESSFPLASESPVHISLAQGMLKDRKMDDLIRPLTELGIDCWMPFYAQRSVPCRVEGKGMEKRLARWRKKALEAVKQCRRGRIPDIFPVADFDAVLAAADSYDQKIIFWEDAHGAFDLPAAAARKVMLVVGPEGGFTPREIDQARAHGFLTAGLGPRILKAETAALAACTLVQYHFGDMGHRS